MLNLPILAKAFFFQRKPNTKESSERVTEWKRQHEIYLLQTLRIQIQLKRMTIDLNGLAESE